MYGEFSEDWAFEFSVFQGRLFVSSVLVLFLGFVVIVSQDMAGHGGGECWDKWVKFVILVFLFYNKLI